MSDEVNNQDQSVETPNTSQDTEVEAEGIASLESGLAGLFEPEVAETDDAAEETSETKPEEGSDAEAEDTEPIPQEQVDLARQLGYSDEEIVKLSETKPQVLENLVKQFAARKEVPPQREEKRDVPPPETPKPFELNGLDKLTPEMQAVLTPLVERLRAQDTELATLKGAHQQSETEKQAEFSKKVDTYFDSIHADLPDVGQGNKLTEAQVGNRMEIYGMAHLLQQTRGLSLEQSLDEASYMWALSKYDLQTLEKQAEERVRGELTKNKKRITVRPGGRKTEKKYNSVEEEGLEILTQGLNDMFNG